MASWMVHFRVADMLMDVLNFRHEQFIVGNIGPDCGEPNEDWSVFTPPSEVSHWIMEVDITGTEDKQISDKKARINSEAFYQRYLKNTQNTKQDTEKQSFYLGYYVHLLTDVLWRNMIYVPTKNKYREQFLADWGFIWKVKEDWYDLDHKYLKDHPDFRAFRIFDKINSFPNVYLDYFSEAAIEKRIVYISEFYNSQHDNLEREYPYLEEIQMNTFVTTAVAEIRQILTDKGLV